MKLLSILLFSIFFVSPGLAMTSDGCGAGSCNECHGMTLDEAKTLLKGGVDQVLAVDFAEVPGMFAVEVEKQGQKFPLYIDFSKKYLLAGNVFRLEDNQNITQERRVELNRVDLSRIPLGDALLLGSPKAKNRVIVFTDPECPFCKRLHEELQVVVQMDPDIAFLIKLFPLKMHPNAYGISKSIVCLGSLELLEASFAGKPVPPPTCETKVVDQTLELGRDIGIRSTPTLVLPDGRMIPGFKKAEEMLRLLGSKAAPPAPAAKN